MGCCKITDESPKAPGRDSLQADSGRNYATDAWAAGASRPRVGGAENYVAGAIKAMILTHGDTPSKKSSQP
jgi:hypothetical protein